MCRWDFQLQLSDCCGGMQLAGEYMRHCGTTMFWCPRSSEQIQALHPAQPRRER